MFRVWQDAAHRLFEKGILRTAVDLDALARDSFPGDEQGQIALSTGLGSLTAAEVAHGIRLSVVQPAALPGEPHSSVWQCEHCRRTHGCISAPVAPQGRVEHPIRIFVVRWLLKVVTAGTIPSGEFDYTLDEIVAAAAAALIMMTPVDPHFTQGVTVLASRLRLSYVQTAEVHSLLHYLCFACGELRLYRGVPTASPVDAFAIMSRGSPCSELPTGLWARGENMGQRVFAGVSLVFLAISRLIHHSASVSARTSVPHCFFRLSPASTSILEPFLESSRASMHAVFALFSLLRCYTEGCTLVSTPDRSPVPGLSETVLTALEADLATVETIAGTLAALYRFGLLAEAPEPEMVVSMLRDARPLRGPPWTNFLAFLGTQVAPVCSELSVYPNREMAVPRLSLTLSFGIGMAREIEPDLVWAHADPGRDRVTRDTADNAAPALCAVSRGAAMAAGVIEFGGLGFGSGSVNLDFAVPPDLPIHDLRIEPAIFSMITRAPLLTRGGTRTHWEIAGPPLAVLLQAIMAINRAVCGGEVPGCVNSVVVKRILFYTCIADFWSPITAEDYTDWLFACATGAPETHCHPLQYLSVDIHYPDIHWVTA